MTSTRSATAPPRRAMAIAAVMLLGALLVPGQQCRAATPALPQGERQIVLVDAAGKELRIGSARFDPDGDASRFSVAIDAPEFRDEFLSMRPFRCLAGDKEMWCHLPYPYETGGRVTASDLVDLEYALLFLFKPPSAYGIDAWNGLYFKLSLGEGGRIAGPVHEVNLDVLAAPPEDRRARVVTHTDLTAVPPDSHRFARVELR